MHAAGGKSQFAYEHLVDKGSWFKNPRILALNGWIAVLLIMGAIDGFDGSGMGGFRSLPHWNNYFGKPEGERLGLLMAIAGIGSIVSLPISPYFMDRFGRCKSIAMGTGLMIISCIIQASATHLEVFMVARFFLGFAIPFAHATPLLIAEIAYPTHRATATSLIGPCVSFGGVLSSWTMLGILKIDSTWGWRGLSLIQASPALVVLISLIWCPESPRWLMSRGRETEAQQLLARYHGDGDINHPLVLVEMEEMRKTLREEQEKRSGGWLSFFHTAGNLRRLRMIVFFAFMSPFSGHALLGHYLKEVLVEVGVTDHSDQLVTNGGLHTSNFIVGFASAFLVERVGRRKMFMTSILGMLLIWIFLTTTFGLYQEQDNDDAGHAFIGLIFVYQAFHQVAFSPLLGTYTIEILPYSLRAKGMTIKSFLSHIFSAFNTYVNPILLKLLEWKYFLVYIVLLIIIATFLYFFVVETRGLTLEETAALFDKDIKNVAEPPIEETTEVLQGGGSGPAPAKDDELQFPPSIEIKETGPGGVMTEVYVSPLRYDQQYQHHQQGLGPQRPPSVGSYYADSVDSRTGLVRKS